ncbi:MAG: DNA primase [Anaerolineae bacterium]
MSVIDEIKQRLDAVEVIGSYVPLKKTGATYKGLCPFHNEKTPSFVVFPDSQSWHCFGACATGGDIFTFVMRRENLDFAETLKLLAQRAGVEVETLSTGGREHADHLNRLRHVNSLAASFYHQVLVDAPEAAAARDYLQRRQVSPASLSAFQLGYAPNDWHRVEQHLRDQGVSQKEALEAGLLASNDSGNVYDRFRGRIMFPIRDLQGHVIGFGGRVLDDSQPKYLNSPQTPLFDKGSVLYGIDRARASIRESGTAIIVEGYMDVIVPHQYGATNTIACMGTALSEAHIDVLKRMCKTLVLALDPDEAGLRAAERGALAATEALPREVVPVPDARGLIRYEERLGAEVRVLLLPDDMDPDELIVNDRERWDILVAGALPVAEFYLERAKQQIDISTARGKQEASDRMLPVIAALDSPVQRTHYLQRLAQWIRIDERELIPQLDRLRGGKAPGITRGRQSERPQSVRQTPDAPSAPVAEVQNLSPEEHCLALVISDPHLAAALVQEARLTVETFTDPRHREIYRQVLPFLYEPEREFDPAYLLTTLDSESGAQVQSLNQRLLSGPPLSEDMFREDLIKSSTRLRRQEISRRIEELRFMQQDAQDEGQLDLARELASQIAELTSEHLRIERRFQAATYVGKRQSHSAEA